MSYAAWVKYAISVVFICILVGSFLFGAKVVYADTFTVTTTADTNDGTCSEDCSLREAIQASNTNAEEDEILFAIPPDDTGYIQPDGARPGTNEPAGAYPQTTHGYYRIQLEERLDLTSQEGVFIDGYSQPNAARNTQTFGEPLDTQILIQLFFSQGNLHLFASRNNHIAGLNIQNASLFLTHQSTNNWIEGNFIGTDITGTQSVPSGWIHIRQGSSVNVLGTNGDGEADNGERNIISGTTPYAVVIGSNTDYLSPQYAPSLRNVVAGNIIGPDMTGESCIADFSTAAVFLAGGVLNEGTRIGSDRNGVSDNEETNIIGCVSHTGDINTAGTIRFHAVDTVIVNNYIGISPSGGDLNTQGEIPFPHIDGTQLSISAEQEGDENKGGIETQVAYENRDAVIHLNTIGYATGPGIHLNGSGHTVEENTIMNGESHGVLIEDTDTLSSQGRVPSENTSIFLNTIADNAGVGVFVDASTTRYTSIGSNDLHENGSLGIHLRNQQQVASLSPTGSRERIQPQVNDYGDLDVSISGDPLLNYPVMHKVGVSADGYLLVRADLDVPPTEGPFLVQFFDNESLDDSGYGEGQYLLGFLTVQSGGTHILLVAPLGQREPTSARYITATTTNAQGATSEFSAVPADPDLEQLGPLFTLQEGLSPQSEQVTLQMGDTGSLLEPTEMMISNNPLFSDGVWEPYAAEKDWTLSPGDGQRRVYVKYRDAQGQESPAFSRTVGVNTPLTPSTPFPLPPGQRTEVQNGEDSGSLDDTTGGDAPIQENDENFAPGQVINCEEQGYPIRGPIIVLPGELGFVIPDLSTILTFLIRLFFVVAGIAGLTYGLWGALDWVISSGDQEKLDKARQKIIAALVGVILIVVVLAVIAAMEQFVFQQRICFGLSCPMKIPGILSSCVPNPQYRSPGFPDMDVSSLAPQETIGTDVECCPNLAADVCSNIRITTGWMENSPSFGDYNYKICCPYGDIDGNQICDDYADGTIIVR